MRENLELPMLLDPRATSGLFLRFLANPQKRRIIEECCFRYDSARTKRDALLLVSFVVGSAEGIIS